METIFHSINEHPALEKQLLKLIQGTWGPITLASEVLKTNWKKLFHYFPAYQFILQQEDAIIGYACTIPFYWEHDLNLLPQEGWDWLLETGIADKEKHQPPNYLGGLMIGIAPAFQGKQWSKTIIQFAKERALSSGLKKLIIPIRPTLKDKYPEVEMEDYMAWKRQNHIFDPWIRTHLDSGAQVVKVCHKAMTIKGSIQEWENWTGEKIVQSGKKVIPGTLSPVEFDIENQIGVYEEPNIWISYTLQ